MNRQFVSLLRSEQDAKIPVIGDHTVRASYISVSFCCIEFGRLTYQVWEKLIGPTASLLKLECAFDPSMGGRLPTRNFPFSQMLKWIYRQPSELHGICFEIYCVIK